jgi:hypothetical protein
MFGVRRIPLMNTNDSPTAQVVAPAVSRASTSINAVQ